jgi:hypothetical protein
MTLSLLIRSNKSTKRSVPKNVSRLAFVIACTPFLRYLFSKKSDISWRRNP